MNTLPVCIQHVMIYGMCIIYLDAFRQYATAFDCCRIMSRRPSHLTYLLFPTTATGASSMPSALLVARPLTERHLLYFKKFNFSVHPRFGFINVVRLVSITLRYLISNLQKIDFLSKIPAQFQKFQFFSC